jgi:copper transport protein
MIRRSAIVAALVALGLLIASPSAQAHALLKSSVPADGAQLQSSPSKIVLSFTEDPDPSLSIVHVIDQNGNNVEKGSAKAVPGRRNDLQVSVGTLPTGSYTVSWRTVSRVDGHVTGGAFAFGVGVPAAPPKVSAFKTPTPSAETVIGRWLFYSGLFLLLGVAAMALFVSKDLARAPPMAHAGWIAALLGLLGLVDAQRRDASVSLGHVFSTSIGHAFFVRAIPLAIAVIGAFVLRRSSSRQSGLVIVLVATAATIFGHVAEGHAATGSWSIGKILLQWIHVVAGGMWIGGLAAVLIGTTSLDADARARAVRRFSALALWLTVVLSGAGVWRAFEEIATWHQLFSTSYGQVVIAKAALLVVLAVLGAVNRYKNVPRSGGEPRGLLATGTGELVLATAVLVLTGILSSVAPARAVPTTTTQAQSVVVNGADFGTTVRLRLTVTRGFPESNRFQLKVTDYNTGAPVSAQTSLRFSFLGPVQIPSSTLPLERTGPGVYTATGSNLSLGGVWTVTAVIQRGVASVEVPLTVPTRVVQTIVTQPTAGQPTIYTVTLNKGASVQFYVDPGKTGNNEVHATFFLNGQQYNGLSNYFVLATPPGDTAPHGLNYRLLAEGHIVSDATLTRGQWRFDVWARTKSGELLWSYFQPTIGP